MTYLKTLELRERYELDNDDLLEMGDVTDDEAEEMAQQIRARRTHCGWCYDSIGRRRPDERN